MEMILKRRKIETNFKKLLVSVEQGEDFIHFLLGKNIWTRVEYMECVISNQYLKIRESYVINYDSKNGFEMEKVSRF